jgi:hypothetical protein
MLSWIIQITIISIISIILVHHLFDFLKKTLTIPKTKDLVNIPSQKYENMYNIIKNEHNYSKNIETTSDYTLIDLLPKEEEETTNIDMKNELKNFLKSTLSTF